MTTRDTISRGLHGGRRPGAGRKPGHTKYGEPTCTMRVPQSLAERLRREGAAGLFAPRSVPLFVSPVAAGLPAFADDVIEEHVDLTERLVRDPETTFLVRARGESMLGAGIHPDDLLVVDRELEATSGRIVIATVDGEPTVKRVRREGGRVLLVPENPDFPVLEVAEEGARILGVVTHVIHAV